MWQLIGKLSDLQSELRKVASRVYTCNREDWMYIDNSSSLSHGPQHPCCVWGFISVTFRWATYGYPSGAEIRLFWECPSQVLRQIRIYGSKIFCETWGGTTLVEYRFFKATFTETGKTQSEGPHYICCSTKLYWLFKKEKKGMFLVTIAPKITKYGFFFYSYLEEFIWCCTDIYTYGHMCTHIYTCHRYCY